MHSKHPSLASPGALALPAILMLSLAACGGPSAPGPETAASAAAPAASTAAEPAADAAAAELAAREEALAAKEAELALREKEQQLAQREADLAAREAAAAAAAAKTATTAIAATPKPATSTSATGTKATAAPPPAQVTVPAGTQFQVALAAPVSTKTAQVGDPVEARLASDLVVDGRRVAKAGATVRGSVTEVVSGSQKIGATPVLKATFKQLALADGTTAAIDGLAAQQGASEKGRDTAKIIGGAAAGAIIGHQIDDDKGKVIGGILGGAAGTAAAKKTGTEVDLAENATVTVALRESFVYSGK